MDEKHSLAKRMEETANRAADDPTTAILNGVCPTPRTKNSGIIPSRLAIVNRVVKDRTPAYAAIERGFRTLGTFSMDVPVEVVLPPAT